MERLNITAPPDWDAYANFLALGGLAEYEGWRDERAGLVKVRTRRADPGVKRYLVVDSEARFSPDAAETYRYYLRRSWDPALSIVAFVMLNPSTADETKLDPTASRVWDFAARMGAGGFVVLNLFALRSTDPAGLRAVVDPIGPENDRILREETEGRRVIFAWGTHGAYLGRDRAVIDLLHDRNPECLSLTKDGCPGHPLYLSAARTPSPFSAPRRPQDVDPSRTPPAGSIAPQTRRKPWRRRP